jgi:RNA polymerase sigma factor (sigma-70 family)
MSERLTEEQQVKVAENMQLVTYISRKYKPPIGLDHDDWYAECMFQLVRAVLYHRPEKGTLSTILDRLVYLSRSNWNSYARRGKRGKVFRSGYLDFSGESLNLLDILGAEHPWEQIEAAQLCSEVMACCTPREQQALHYLSEGMNQREIAAIYGVSKQRVSEILTTAREKIAERFPTLAVYSQTCANCHQPAQNYGRGTNLYCTVCSKKIRNERKRLCDWNRKLRTAKA